jgi:acyl-CoA thioesterase I
LTAIVTQIQLNTQKSRINNMKTSFICTFILFLGLFSIPCKAEDNRATVETRSDDQPTYLRELYEQMKIDWPKNRTINIVCHGHSVPAGYFKTPEVETMNAYPHLLHKELAAKFPHAVINVIVTAIGGENSEQGAARFERDVLALKPDLVTIDYSLNDRGLGMEQARKAWGSMIEKAQKAGVKVILLTPTPDQNAKMDDPQDPLQQHARQVRELAAKYRVALADSTKAFQDEIQKGKKLEELMSQINHPNRQGHELVVKELMKWFP